MSKESIKGIKSWAVEDRPREKLIRNGIQNLSNTELIAILIRSGTTNTSAVEVARVILHQAENNLNTLGKKTINDLKKIKGMGEAKAIAIVAALELGRRRKLSDVLEKQKITGSHDVYTVFYPMLADLSYEEFWILLLNRSNKIIERQKISQGGVSGTVIDIKMILKSAVEKLASSIILCHNHPSGNLKPSEADINITNKLKEAAAIMDIKMLDHIITGNERYYSFADEGII